MSELDSKRNRRFPIGFNGDLRLSPLKKECRGTYRPLFFIFMAKLYCFLGVPGATLTQPILASTPSSHRSMSETKPAHKSTIIVERDGHCHPAARAIPASSLAMISSLSNLSSIGLCTAPPLRTRQRSRTIDVVIACAQAQIPKSSLAMMSSLSNLSSIGMCTAPPLRTRQRSRTATSASVVGYASAVPFRSSQKISAAA